MTLGLKTLLRSSWLLLLLGCETEDRRIASGRLALQASAGPVSSQSGTHDQQVLFNSLDFTNQLRREWLVSPTNFFRLGPGDAIEIEVLGEANSTSASFVGPDGKVYYSLLDGTFVWGLTLTETKDLLEKELAKFVRVKPEVALTLRSVGSQRVWILGSVQKPGVYPLATPVTLLEAISAAGGIGTGSAATGGAAAGATPSEQAVDLENSFLIREGNLMQIDFSRLLRQGDLSQNVYLQPDDFLYLRPGVSRGDVYVLGAVVQPNIVEYREHTSLLSAIATVGGPVPYAYLSHVAVIRGSLAHPSIAIFDYKDIIKGKGVDVRLQPGDIVYVPFSPYRDLQKFAEQILNQFVSTVAINAGNHYGGGTTPVGVTVPFSK